MSEATEMSTDDAPGVLTSLPCALVALQDAIRDIGTIMRPIDVCSEECAGLRVENARLMRLLRQHPPPRPQILPQRRLKLAARQTWRCALCREILSEAFHLDHIRPWSETFDDRDSNIQACCIPCHLSKTSEESSARNTKRHNGRD